MSLSFTGTGGMFTRLDKRGAIVSALRTMQRTTLPFTGAGPIENLFAQHDGERKLVGQEEAAYNRLRADQIRYLHHHRDRSIDTVREMVQDDTYFNHTLEASIDEVIRQMDAGAVTIKEHTVALGAGAAGLANIGTGALIWTLTRPDGLSQQNIFDETLPILCVEDSLSGRAVAGNEVFSVKGFTGVNDPLHPDWGTSPFGSGCDLRIKSVFPRNGRGNGNELVNGNLENWTGTVPDYFVVSDASSQITKTTTAGEYYNGSGGLKLAGHATGTPYFYQAFNTSAGSPYVIKGLTNYCASFWSKVSSNPAAGVLTVEVTDNAGNVVTDEEGVSQAKTWTLSSHGTTFVNRYFDFRLKKNPPSVLWLRWRISTAMSAGSNLFIDWLTLQEMTRCYPSGPYLAIASGATNWVREDRYTQIFTNNRGGASNLDSFQTFFHRVFRTDLMDGGIGKVIPYDAAPSISGLNLV